MPTGFEHLLAEGVITEVLGRLQSGKEAEVYVVRFGGKVVAAKVYKDRATRSFKNNSSYKEGRTVRNTRSQRAMDRGSRFGKAASEDAWKSAEADALYKLHAEGVRVPTPVLFLDGVLLMELVLDAEGNPAQRIIDAHLTPAEANAAYHDMLTQLVRILSCDLIHGDLSPYNVLWAAAGPTVIDFPQIVSASHNSSSERFFLRDAENILGHFARIDRSLMARRSDPWEIWQAYRRRELTPEFRPTGKGSWGGRSIAQDAPRGEPRHAHGGPRGDMRDVRNAHAPQRHGPPQQRPNPPPLRQPPHPPSAAGRRPQFGPEVIVRNRRPGGMPGGTAVPVQGPAAPSTTGDRPSAPGNGASRQGRRRRRRRH
ncbi:MAG: RIO1 family regulatory kinase/ATPase [Polyangiaceae bacterium]